MINWDDPRLSGLPGDSNRVMAILRVAVSDGDRSAADVVDDLVLAAAALMASVAASAGVPPYPPLSGRPRIDSCRQAIGALAEGLMGRRPEDPS